MGFDADWLALREPADHQARDKNLLRKAASLAGEKPVIMDLGCGTGSTIRALGPLLPKNSCWRLVDNDEALLKVANQELGDSASLHCLDIQNLDQLPLQGVSLITASALLDLVSKQWLSDFLTKVQVPVYFALTYDGTLHWSIEDPQDSEIREAFNSHQQTDKGIGTALGPKAADAAIEILEDLGFEILSADSPWILETENVALQQSLVTGISQAASEVGNTDSASWLERRIAKASEVECTVGHVDILAIPAGWQGEVEREIS